MQFSKVTLTDTSVEPRYKRVALVLLVFLGAIAAANLLPGTTEDIARYIPLKCPLKQLFGIECPTCGLGRSLIAAFRGEWASSYRYHALGIPVLVLTLWKGVL